MPLLLHLLHSIWQRIKSYTDEDASKVSGISSVYNLTFNYPHLP